jgi:lysophospholipid acyltransferase (LPLAT)-like uncharacterized protein
MAGLILDSMGTQKMKTLDDAVLQVQRLHGLIETLNMNAKKGSPSQSVVASIKRQLTTLAANLKSHFGMISDLVTNVYISSSRGSSDAARARVLREGLASIKQAIDIGITQTKDKHAVHREKPASGASQADS